MVAPHKTKSSNLRNITLPDEKAFAIFCFKSLRTIHDYAQQYSNKCIHAAKYVTTFVAGLSTAHHLRRNFLRFAKQFVNVNLIQLNLFSFYKTHPTALAVP